ncbi:MAG: carbohydrate-binding protein, partial [Candidatus Symbiothrix sp.]|nr:carbohydrate-binding protein [Candidatus Symbiothrix sp.]
YTTWNQGYNYRNDGVDIQGCNDAQPRNGYSVAWIEDGEWLNYTFASPEEKSYTLQIRYASASGGGQIYVEVNGKRASKTIDVPATGDWNTWSSVFIPNLILPQGTVNLKLVFEKGGFNLNWFNLTRGKEVGFDLVFANTHHTDDEVQLNFSKEITSFTQNSFAAFVNGETVNIRRVRSDVSDKKKLFLALDKEVTDYDQLHVSYILAGGCMNGDMEVSAFNYFPVDNTMATLYRIPCRVEAEDYLNVNNFTFQACEDDGGGQNAGYTSSGSYLDFFVYAQYAGKHHIDVRVAVNASSRIRLMDVTSGESASLGDLTLNVTGGWQNWATQSAEISLRKGKNILRFFAVGAGFNLNWIELMEIPGAGIASPESGDCMVYAESGEIRVKLPSVPGQTKTVLFDLSGKPCLQAAQSHTDKIEINTSSLPQGLYLMQISTDQSVYTRKIVLK